jgi:hypothetical protein
VSWPFGPLVRAEANRGDPRDYCVLTLLSPSRLALHIGDDGLPTLIDVDVLDADVLMPAMT